MSLPHRSEPLPPAAVARVILPGEGATIHVLDEAATFKVGPRDSGGAFSLVEVETPPGGGSPEHLHETADEVLYVVEGEFRLSVEGREARLDPGACAVVPRGMRHAYVNVGARRGRLLMVSAPAVSQERVFVELAALFAGSAAGSPELAEAMAQIAMARGLTITGEHQVPTTAPLPVPPAPLPGTPRRP